MAKCEGVTHYIKATAEIYFPDGHVCCELCPFTGDLARKAM